MSPFITASESNCNLHALQKKNPLLKYEFENISVWTKKDPNAALKQMKVLNLNL